MKDSKAQEGIELGFIEIHSVRMKMLRGERTMVYSSRLKDPYIDELFQAVLLLETPEECYRFFEDICTVSEIKAMAQRLEVAKMLERDIKYTEIAEKTGASTATISRVKRCLFFGADGYQLVLQRIKERLKRKNENRS